MEGKRRSNTTSRRRTWHREDREKEGKGQCPPSPPLISSISSNHCDRRRAREGESEQGRESSANGRSQEEAGEVAGEGDRENESKKRRVAKKREGEYIRLKIWQRG